MIKFYTGDIVRLDIAKAKKLKWGKKWQRNLKKYGITGRRYGVCVGEKIIKNSWPQISTKQYIIHFDVNNSKELCEVIVDGKFVKLIKSAPRHPLTNIFV